MTAPLRPVPAATRAPRVPSLHDAAARAGGRGETVAGVLALSRIARSIVGFAAQAAAQGDWAAHVPVAGDILPRAVIHLRAESGVLSIRFETSDWDSRDWLRDAMPLLLPGLRQAIPAMEIRLAGMD